MKKNILTILAACMLISGAAALTSQSKDSDKPHVAVFGFLNRTGDSNFDLPAESAGDSLYIGMRMLGSYEVSRPKSKPETADLDAVGAWCDENGMDYILFGDISADGAKQKYRLSSFDNGKKKVTVSESADGESVMDVFEASDKLILSMLDALTGRHVGFGKIKFVNTGAEGTYIAYIDGLELEANAGTIDHIVSGSHLVTVAQVKPRGNVQIASEPISVPEGKTATFAFILPELPKPPKPELDSYKELIVAPIVGVINYRQSTGPKTGFRHNISLFALGKYEVTFELWNEVMQWAESPDRGSEVYQLWQPGKRASEDLSELPEGETEHQPVANVSWFDCIIWCNAYSEMTGLEPVYYADKNCTQPIRSITDLQIENGTFAADRPFVKKGAMGYRLPTSGEWQYAASCANAYGFDFPSGADVAANQTSGTKDVDRDGIVRYAESVAWHANNSGFHSHPVGTKAPNVWGYYDMSGNVWEMTYDWEGTAPKTAQTDYAGPTSGTRRVIRGGGFAFATIDTEIGRINGIEPNGSDTYTGFRVCRSE
jgi:formylglycine-generating enzyme required for sulfatase activity